MPITAVADYKERVSYDGNGNILTYERNGSIIGGKPLAMDDLQYGYNKTDGNLVDNRLRHVKDAIDNDNYKEDIDNQEDDNYGYDAIGNLISDDAEKITNIKWNVYGKIEEITKTPTAENPVTKISYTYDVAGNRISKKVDKQGADSETTWYVRDASGNTMAVYSHKDALKLSEQHVYGSSRLGVVNKDMLVADPSVSGESNNLLGTTYINSFERGKKFFELTNHLGNVLVTISDKRLQVTGNEGNESNGECEAGTGENILNVIARNNEPTYIAQNEVNLMPGFDSEVGDDYSAYTDATLADCIDYTAPSVGTEGWYYAAEIISANDYYPFGMDLVNRTWNSIGYRYGFNGKEMDNDIYGRGNIYDYGFRIYNPRIGKFLSVDPLSPKYPWYTPYQFAGNKPIAAIDLDGAEELWRTILGEGIIAPILRSRYAKEVAQGFYERAAETVHGIKSLFKGNSSGGGGPNAGLLATAHSLELMEANQRAFAAALSLPSETLVNFIKDYANLISKTFEGDGKAAGGLLFEGLMFFVPEIKGLGTANVAAKSLKSTDEIINGLNKAKEAIESGVKEFKTLDNLTVSGGKTFDASNFHLPSSNGTWNGAKGNSKWFSDLPEVNIVTGGEGIPYVNGIADFSKWAVARFEVSGLTGTSKDFRLVYKYMKENFGFKSQRAAKKWLKDNNLTPHHGNGNTIELISTDLNKVPHQGGASELRKTN